MPGLYYLLFSHPERDIEAAMNVPRNRVMCIATADQQDDIAAYIHQRLGTDEWTEFDRSIISRIETTLIAKSDGM